MSHGAGASGYLQVRPAGDAETLLKLNVMDCFSCKCCEYICSSKIPLVSKINAAKGLVMPLLKKK